jgi:RES domain-containing protein
MLVYNKLREKYAASLITSGIANRWNKKDEFVIYTGSSISLAALEMIAHRAGILLNQPYRLLSIQLHVNEKDITTIHAKHLPFHWKSIEAYSQLQSIGSE